MNMVTTLNTEHGLTGKELKSGFIKFADCSFASVRKTMKAVYPDKKGKELDELVQSEVKRRKGMFRAGHDVALGEATRKLNSKDFAVKFDEDGNLIDGRFHYTSEKAKSVSPLKLLETDKRMIRAMVNEDKDIAPNAVLAAIAAKRGADCKRLEKAVFDELESAIDVE